MHNVRAHLDTRSTIQRLRRRRRDVVRRRRRNRLLIGSGAIAFALSTTLAVAGFTGTDLAGAAVTRAASLTDLMEGRSPGARTEAQLTKTKARHRVLAERDVAPPVHVPLNLAEVIAPPEVALVSVDIPKAPAALLAAPIPGAVFFSPPGGGGGVPGGDGGGPGGGGGTPPGSPPGAPPLISPPAVPEPGTWMTMLTGFAFIGWSFRRQRKPLLARAKA